MSQFPLGQNSYDAIMWSLGTAAMNSLVRQFAVGCFHAVTLLLPGTVSLGRCELDALESRKGSRHKERSEERSDRILDVPAPCRV